MLYKHRLLKAHYYDPELRSFLSKDAFEGHGNLAASWHSYQYAYNNPLKWVDPSGNFTTGIESTQREQIINLPKLTDRDTRQLINIENKDQYSDYLLDKHLKNDKPLSTYEGDRLETYLNEYGNWAVDTYGQEKGLGLLQGLLTPSATIRDYNYPYALGIDAHNEWRERQDLNWFGFVKNPALKSEYQTIYDKRDNSKLAIRNHPNMPIVKSG